MRVSILAIFGTFGDFGNFSDDHGFLILAEDFSQRI